MEYKEILEEARKNTAPHCMACPVCNGKACGNNVPGPGCKFPGATATRNYEKWQEIFVNMDTLCENIADPDVSFELFGRKFAAPIFVAPLGAVDMHYGPKYNDQSYNAELMRAAPVLAAVAAVAAIFPRRAVGFAAADPRPAEPSAAFVVLTEDEEDEAVRAAKTAWLASGGRRGRGGLPLGALPEMESGPILGGEVLLPPAKEPRPVEWGKSAWRPSADAPAPKPIPDDARAKPESAFSRAELLSIENRKGDIP